MAMNPNDAFPARTTPPDANYPYGGAQNVTTPSDGTGTPWIASLINDVFGFQQALLQAAGIVPSGSPDTAVLSQYLDALNALILAGSSGEWTSLTDIVYSSTATLPDSIIGKRAAIVTADVITVPDPTLHVGKRFSIIYTNTDSGNPDGTLSGLFVQFGAPGPTATFTLHHGNTYEMVPNGPAWQVTEIVGKLNLDITSLALDSSNWPNDFLRFSEDWAGYGVPGSLRIYPSNPVTGSPAGAAAITYTAALASNAARLDLQADMSGPYLIADTHGTGGIGQLQLKQPTGLTYFDVRPSYAQFTYSSGTPAVRYDATQFQYFHTSGFPNLTVSDVLFAYTQSGGSSSGFVYELGRFYVRDELGNIVLDSDVAYGTGDFLANGSVPMTGTLQRATQSPAATMLQLGNAKLYDSGSGGGGFISLNYATGGSFGSSITLRPASVALSESTGANQLLLTAVQVSITTVVKSGTVTLNDTPPVANNDLTRKDYVDGLKGQLDVYTTAGRPSPDLGLSVYDSDLSIPIYGDGTDWRNAVGVIV